MNDVALSGRLTRDPELRSTPNGVSICNFSIAVRRDAPTGEGEYLTDFINCFAWRNTGEFISKYFKKGQLIEIKGTLQSRSWDDVDGKKRFAVEVATTWAGFLGPKTEEKTTVQHPTPLVPQQANTNSMKIIPNEDDLPF